MPAVRAHSIVYIITVPRPSSLPHSLSSLLHQLSVGELVSSQPTTLILSAPYHPSKVYPRFHTDAPFTMAEASEKQLLGFVPDPANVANRNVMEWRAIEMSCDFQVPQNDSMSPLCLSVH